MEARLLQYLIISHVFLCIGYFQTSHITQGQNATIFHCIIRHQTINTKSLVLISHWSMDLWYHRNSHYSIYDYTNYNNQLYNNSNNVKENQIQNLLKFVEICQVTEGNQEQV